MSQFCILENADYKTFNTKMVKSLPVILDDDDIFSLICKKYKI
jgi:hypothetical protein